MNDFVSNSKQLSTLTGESLVTGKKADSHTSSIKNNESPHPAQSVKTETASSVTAHSHPLAHSPSPSQTSTQQPAPQQIEKILNDVIKNLSKMGMSSIDAEKVFKILKEQFPSELIQLKLKAQEQGTASTDQSRSHTARVDIPPLPAKTMQSWFQGQIVHAQVMRVDSVNSQNTSISLLIDKQVLDVSFSSSSPVRLQSGQKLALIVDKNTAGQPLQLILATLPWQSEILIRAIESLTSKQQSMANLLASVDSFVKQKENLLPGAVSKNLQGFLASLTSMQELGSTQGLKQGLARSGIFLENRLQIIKQDFLVIHPSQSAPLQTLQLSQTLDNLLQKITAHQNSPQLFNLSHSDIENIKQILSQLQEHISSLNQNRYTLQNYPPLLQTDKHLQALMDVIQSTPNNLLSALKQVKQLLQNSERWMQSYLPLTNTTNMATMADLQTSANIYPRFILQASQQLLSYADNRLQQISSLSPTQLTPANVNIMQAWQQQLQQFRQFLQQIINQSSSISYVLNRESLQDVRTQLQHIVKVVTQNQESSQTQHTSTALLQQIQQLLSGEQNFFRQPLATRHLHAQVQKKLQHSLLLALNPLNALSGQSENTIARILATAAANREQADSNFNLALEIPFRFMDKSEIMQLKIRQEENKKEGKSKKIWTANLAFELEKLGPVRIYIALQNKDVSIQFWSEKATTQKCFSDNFYLLKQRLTEFGYRITSLSALLGIPEDAEKEIQHHINRLIDEKV